ncbi:MAG: hydrogen gas-evolving membrane-bound hydrogenase subunit E, partial [Pseudomonadota bacterium]
KHPQRGRFFSFLLMFMASMLGLVLADDLLTLFVFWELTSITSFLLIGFDHTKAASRRAALQALLITGGGGLALLAGLLLMGSVTGATSVSELVPHAEMLADHPLYMAMLLLLLGGAFTKSAQFPLHFWLPNAMEAPTPVSAYLHSATMVKAGVYLLARFNPIMGETDMWSALLGGFGAVTFLYAVIVAVKQDDLKQILAFTTVASLGLLVMLIGLGGETMIKAAVLYLIAHSFFKGGLFMVAGCIDHETGTRDVNKLGGLLKVMPITAIAALAGAISMGGLPPAFGFIAKEVMYEAGLHGPYAVWAVISVLLIGNAFMFMAGALVAVKPFFGERIETPKHAHEGPIELWFGPVVLAVLGMGFGLFSGLAGNFIVGPMSNAIYGELMNVYLKLWHGFNLPLLLSVITVAAGIALYRFRDNVRAFIRALNKTIGWGPDHGYDQAVGLIERSSRLITPLIQNGELHRYTAITFVVVALTLIWGFLFGGGRPTSIEWEALKLVEWVLPAITLVAAATVVIVRSRLAAIAALGVVGTMVALIFMVFAAPDLAFTQFMVETLSIIIIAYVLARLPLSAADGRGPMQRIRDGVIAVVCGITFASTLMAVTAGNLDLTLSEYFTANSYTEAFGRNIVNVILVDFRGVDTFGEIAVVLLAGLGVLALMKLRAPKADAEGGKS